MIWFWCCCRVMSVVMLVLVILNWVCLVILLLFVVGCWLRLKLFCWRYLVLRFGSSRWCCLLSCAWWFSVMRLSVCGSVLCIGMWSGLVMCCRCSCRLVMIGCRLVRCCWGGCVSCWVTVSRWCAILVMIFLLYGLRWGVWWRRVCSCCWPLWCRGSLLLCLRCWWLILVVLCRW